MNLSFLKIDQIQLATKYALMWIEMCKHIPWDHAHSPITFLPHVPQKGGNYEFSKNRGVALSHSQTPGLYLDNRYNKEKLQYSYIYSFHIQ